jgi:hypothetical protein
MERHSTRNSYGSIFRSFFFLGLLAPLDIPEIVTNGTPCYCGNFSGIVVLQVHIHLGVPYFHTH